MLDKVVITTPSGEILTLELGDLSTGIFIKEISGLGPVKATVVSSNYAGRDGVQFQTSRRESRDIIMKLGLDSRYGGSSVAEIRHHLYRYFMPKSDVKLTFFMTSGLEVDIWGHVEDVQAPMFVQKPEATITIQCFDPDFIDPIPVLGSGEGYPAGLQEYEILYDGSVETGITIQLELNAGATGEGFEVHHRTPRDVVHVMEFAAQLQGSDKVRLETTPGQKAATLIRNGIEESILYGVSPQTSWIQLVPGMNTIGIRVTGDTQQSYYEYSYLKRYGAL